MLTNRSFLVADAKNRSVRTLLQGLAFDVGAALALILVTTFSSANGWGDFEWKVLGFMLAKTAVVTGLSYLMRTVLDGSVPTPLPPQEPGEPADPSLPINPEAGYAPSWLLILVGILVVLAILWLLGIGVNVG